MFPVFSRHQMEATVAMWRTTGEQKKVSIDRDPIVKSVGGHWWVNVFRETRK